MRLLALFLIVGAMVPLWAGEAGAQTTPANQSLSAPAGAGANPAPNPSLPPAASSAKSPAAPDDATLEVAPRIIPLPPTVPEASSAPEGENAANPDNGGGTPLARGPAGHGRPYLGVSVQPALVRFKKQEIRGLEIVAVDKNSPAERAGFAAPAGMTTVGATGQTASFFLGPMGELVSPLLARSGQLGVAGDMIVAVDDQRVTDAAGMNGALAHAGPGDTVWFTLMRITREGKVKNEKIPVVLGSAENH
jgi:hypothetical protein